MRFLLLGAVPCLLVVQAAHSSPLTFADLERRLRPSPLELQTETLLAERQRDLVATSGFLREGPTLIVDTGLRRAPGSGLRGDHSLQVDLPLFLGSEARRELARAYGRGAPLLREAARLDSRFQLWKSFLAAWLNAETLAVRETDLVTLEAWRKAAKARVEAGADPAFQSSLVDGEWLRALQERDEARQRSLEAWDTLRALLVDLPDAPQPLSLPETPSLPGDAGLETLYRDGILRRVLQSRQELESGSLRLREAAFLGRWSVRGSTAKEGDEAVTRLGVAVRLPRPGETAAIRQSRSAQTRELDGSLHAEQVALDSRFQRAAAGLRSARSLNALPEVSFVEALGAVGLRLREGKDRPSEALSVRRQLLDGQLAALRRRHSLYLLLAELQALTETVAP